MATTARSLLRSELESPRTREIRILRVIGVVFSACVLAALFILPLIGWKLAALNAAVLAAGGAAYFVQARLMERGIFHPIQQWVNATIEVSTPSIIFVLDSLSHGAEYALTAPPLIFWGTVVMISGVRARRTIAIYAGAVAAIEYALLYALLAYPHLPETAPISLRPGMIAVRCFLLFTSGVLAAVMLSELLARAEEAFRAVRERDVFGKYLLHERIGAGGMAEVFRATYSPEGGFEKTVAVKKVLPAYAADQEFITLFKREAELCSRLSHPNIVQVLDLGRHEGSYFLTMEFVDGISLHALFKAMNKPLPLSAVSWLGAELASALDYIHRRANADGVPLNLVHRDINPPNVLISRGGEVKLSDFGIARAADQVSLTAEGIVRGKSGYMPPEQIYGEPLDGRADLFAAGVTLYEALTGQKPFEAKTQVETLQATIDQPLVPPSVYRPEIPSALDDIVVRLLERDRDKRLPSAGLLRAALLELKGAAAALPSGPQLLGISVREALTARTRSLRAEAETADFVGGPDLQSTQPTAKETAPVQRQPGKKLA